MNIIKNLKKTGNYNTKLYCILNNLNGIKLYNNEHDLRHPLSIYTISFSKVMDSCNEVLNLLREYDKSVKEKYVSFLSNVNSFIDDGYNILKCFFNAKLVDKRIVFADKWLEKVDFEGITKYKNDIKPYIETTRYIVNKIKHEHGRISQIIIRTPFGNCMGYFLEKYHNDTLEPDESIHKKYKNEYTGFSYKLDIMRNLVMVYYISEKLAQYLEKNVLSEGFSCNIVEDKENDKIVTVVDKIWQVPNIVFPDEYNKRIDILEINKEKEELVIKFPAPNYYNRRFIQYTKCKIELHCSGDGTSRTYAIPYLQNN